MPGDAKRKGDFLEDLVGFLHEIAGHVVERKARMPVVDGSRRKREIDVLLRVTNESLGNCPVYIPIECRNYGKRIGIDQIDGFIGKLHDVGIPTNLGIFVAASSYTADALGRAKEAGIKTLVARGLTKDRLAIEIQDVLHSVVIWLATWSQTSQFPSLPGAAGPDAAIVAALPAGTDWKTGTLNAIWRLWLAGEIPCELGEHDIFIKIGTDEVTIATVEVTAHCAALAGWISAASLAQAESGETERVHVRSQVALPSDAITLTRFDDKAGMEAAISRTGVHLGIRAPRIVGPGLYWPPTHETLDRLRQLIQRGDEVTFDKIEGPNLLRAWAFSGTAVDGH